MMKLKFFPALFLLFFTSVALATAPVSPLPLLRSVSDQVIMALKANRAYLKQNPRLADKIVSKYLLPHVNQIEMAQQVMGPSWNRATPQQKREFIKQFRILVIRTYAAAFSQFSNETVKLLPIRESVAGRQRVTVQSYILRNSGPRIAVAYVLQRKSTSAPWKLTDFSVDGVSMVRSFRAQFVNQLAQKNGVATLIANLKKHNARTKPLVR